jgi:hypothetical protein
VLLTVTDSLVTRNRWVDGGEDGMKLVDSQRVIVSHNSCTGFAPLPGYHPDCIQMWSAPDKPLQSDIYLLNNYALGPQQAFASFDPSSLSGTRINFIGNYAATLSPHSISCFGCTDSLFLDNVLITLPEARWLAPFRVTGSGTGNVYAGNQQLDLRGQFDAALQAPVWSSFTPSIAGLVGSQWDLRDHGLLPQSFAASAPEPASWAMLMAGFGLVGAALRQRRSAFQAALHHHDVEPASEFFANLPQQAGLPKAAGRVQADRGFIA